MDDKVASQLLRGLAKRENYFVRRIWRIFPPDSGEEWEVLFIGRYQGDDRANIPGDEKDAELPYTAFIRPDGSGYITADW